MITVKNILDEKGSAVWTITPEATVYDALKLMAEKGVGALVIVEGEEIAGMLSERDYARKVALHGKFAKDIPVREIMTPTVYSVNLDTTADECMALMTDKHVRHLPICREGKLAGIISIGDVVKAVLSQQKVTIENLENYIMGKYQ